jgi:hypothetical protein
MPAESSTRFFTQPDRRQMFDASEVLLSKDSAPFSLYRSHLNWQSEQKHKVTTNENEQRSPFLEPSGEKDTTRRLVCKPTDSGGCLNNLSEVVFGPAVSFRS